MAVGRYAHKRRTLGSGVSLGCEIVAMSTEAEESVLLGSVIRQRLEKTQETEKIWCVLYSYGRNVYPCKNRNGKLHLAGG
jgi:hypothetical protein